jgi:hypothetical protein
MAGNEQPFCDALDEAIKSLQPGEPFIYLEVGVGNGDTMLAVASWLNQRDIPYFIIGIDLPEYSGTARNLGWNTIKCDGSTEEYHPMNISYVGADHFLLKTFLKANFIFIDGCHGSPCATHDFLLAEKVISDGGVICFHDTDPNCQGQHFQNHCQMPIDVRKAVEDLGLIDDSRPNWAKICETWGDKARGGHGALFVKHQKPKK